MPVYIAFWLFAVLIWTGLNVPLDVMAHSTPAISKASAAIKNNTSSSTDKPETAVKGPVESVSPIDLLKSPQQYLYKRVAFEGIFNSFSSLGLDYKRALRDGKDYVSLLILRPDVWPDHKIPMSELKLFYPRKKSDTVMHLDAGDRIALQGQVFGTALGEPWVDIQSLTVISKAPKKPSP